MKPDRLFRTDRIAELADDDILHTSRIGNLQEELDVETPIDLPVDQNLWQNVDEIRAELYLPAGLEHSDMLDTIRCDVTLDTRSPGFDYNDGYWLNAIVSRRGGNVWSGWREFRFPKECFYTRGIPAEWTNIKTVQIGGPKGAKIRNIRLLQRSIAAGPRMTDETLVSAIDVTHPGLESVVPSDTGPENLNRIAAYFRSVSTAEAPDGKESVYVRRTLPTLRNTVQSSLVEAETILSGRIRDNDWSGGIDWDANPQGYIEWSIRTHLLSFLDPLVAAWWETRDDRFARMIASVLEDWMQRHPVPYGLRACGLAWGHSLVVAARAYETLVEAFAAICSCNCIEDRYIIDTLKSIWEHANYLIAFESFPPSNKTISEGRTLAAIGCAVPEFRDAAAWRRIGFGRLNEDMRIQVLEDGASYELSPGYQLAIAAWFLEAYETGVRYGFSEGEPLRTGIEKMYRWSASIIRPDFSRPSISDAGSLDAKYGADLEGPGRLLGDDTLVWVGTEGAEGTIPKYDSIAMRDSGYFVMRSGWDQDDVYMLFEGGPFGKFHQHEDMLNIDIYAHGSPFIVDPGITSYFQNDWTTWYRTTHAHNTVLIDGCGQSRRAFQSQEQWIESAAAKTFWHSDDFSDVAVATYEGPFGACENTDVDGAGPDAPVFRHRRSVLFVKPGYFVVFDELTGDGTHTFEALFHFMPYRVLIDADTGAIRTGRMDKPNIELLPLTDLDSRLICGQNDPVQGWVSIDHQDVPAPVAILSTKTELPLRTGYVIAPFRAGQPTAEICADVNINSGKWSVRVERPGSTELIHMDWSETGPRLVAPESSE